MAFCTVTEAICDAFRPEHRCLRDDHRRLSVSTSALGVTRNSMRLSRAVEVEGHEAGLTRKGCSKRQKHEARCLGHSRVDVVEERESTKPRLFFFGEFFSSVYPSVAHDRAENLRVITTERRKQCRVHGSLLRIMLGFHR